MRRITRGRPLAGAVAGVLLAAASAALVPSTAQAAGTTPVSGILGGVRPGSWRFDGSVTTLAEARASTGSRLVSRAGYTGKGVGVALVDTGVVPVPGLTSGNVVDGPDLSFESQVPQLAHLDTFGHGTHMAGIIAGNDPATGFQGVAPSAKLTSVKVGVSDGAVDVSQVIAAIDWVVAHRNDDPQNPIRVLNLSYGTDGVQDYQVDPLTHAVENAWRAGIVVVVAGGNSGFGGDSLNNPAYDPYVLAVGAADLNGTLLELDDTVPDFSSRGDAQRRVDLVAPGKSVASLRDPGSYVDAGFPDARVGWPAVQGQRHLAGRGVRVGRRRPAAPAAAGSATRPGEGPAHVQRHAPVARRRRRPRRGRAQRAAGQPDPSAERHPELPPLAGHRVARGGARQPACRGPRRRSDRGAGHLRHPVGRARLGRRQQQRHRLGRRQLDGRSVDR